jgi:peptide/nickel transport system permease protein
MWAYIVRRIVQAIFILFIITMLCFILTRLSSDPMSQYANKPGITAADRAAIAKNLGLDQPMPVQYVKWLWLAVQGDLGSSFFSRQPVLLMIQQRLPLTLILMSTAEVVIVIVSLILGLIAAIKQYSFTDNLITSFSFVGYSMPTGARPNPQRDRQATGEVLEGECPEGYHLGPEVPAWRRRGAG